MASTLATQVIRTSVRRFSARPPRPETRAQRFLAASCITSAVVLPFIPPAIESSREKKSPSSTHHGRQYPPLCFHAR